MAPSSSITYTLPTLQLVCNLVIPGQVPAINNNTTNRNSGLVSGENSSSQPPIPSFSIPDGYVAHPDIGAAYKIYNGTVSWKIARTECIREGARLAVINNYIKFEYLISQSGLVNAIHVGIHSMYDDTEWVSATTGETSLTTPWAPGNPSGAYDCVVAGYNPRGLRNVACITKAYYVCEIPISNNHNSLVN